MLLTRGKLFTFAALGAFLAVFAAHAGEVIRRPLEPGVYALGKDGRTLGLEVILPAGRGAQGILSKYLGIESEWIRYRNRLNSFVPLLDLKADYQRRVLLAVYEHDYVDERGWMHEAVFDEETLWSICALITGNGNNYKEVVAHPANRGIPTTLHRGDRVLIPEHVLDAVMREPTPERVPRVDLPEEPAIELASLEDGLRYGSDRDGEFAAYTLKRGETIYGSVVARFTDIRDNADMIQACELIASRSQITDMRDIDAGRVIRIPVELLADRYRPQGTPERERYEAVLREAKRLKGDQGRSKDLSDVVVILDPGHGGKDTGAKHSRSGLYEDEINYDIVCRIKALLEQDTGARVYVTLVDRSSGFASTDAKRFTHDEDEELLTTPRHKNADGSAVSANLRWMLVNSIYQDEVDRGTDSKKIIFTSVHTDMLYNERLRGAMIYIPGARYRRAEEIRMDKLYAKYQEGRSFNHFTSSSEERRRDEAISRNFAEVLLDELGTKRVKRHDHGDPIRSQIRRSRTQVFVPAVLRNTKVPTKVLLESANLNNATDRQRLSDPWWRQQVALAYVDALKRYYDSELPTRVAKSGQ